MTITIAGMGFVADQFVGWASEKTLEQIFAPLLERRVKTAQEILFKKISEGTSLPVIASQQDELLSILYRYFRAATEGSARLNMRLLVNVIAGQKEHGVLSASEFLYYADLLTPLRREEIILMGELHKQRQSPITKDKENIHPQLLGYKNCVSILVPSLFKSEDLLKATAVALTRTGLVREYVMGGFNGWSDTYYYTTPLMDILCLASNIDETLRSEK